MKKLKTLLKRNDWLIQKGLLAFLIAFNLAIFLKPNLYLNELSGKTPLPDFDSYRVQIESVKHGINPYTSAGMVTLGPPLVLVYFYPFSFLNIPLARCLVTLLNIGCGILLCYLLAKNYFSKRKLIWFLTFSAILFSAFPTRFSIGMGQPDLLAALLVGLMIIKGRENLKGFSLAVLSIVKSFFLFSFLAFFLKERKIFVKGILFLTGTIILSFIFIKPEWYSYYFVHELPKTIFSQVSPTWPDYYNQSLRSTLFRLNLSGLYGIIFPLLLILSGIAIFLTSSFELSIVAAILLSPISWQHYYVVLFPIFVMLFIGSKKSLKKLFWLSLALILWWIEFPWLHHAGVNLFAGLLASHYFISGTILICVMLDREFTKVK